MIRLDADIDLITVTDCRFSGLIEYYYIPLVRYRYNKTSNLLLLCLEAHISPALLGNQLETQSH